MRSAAAVTLLALLLAPAQGLDHDDAAWRSSIVPETSPVALSPPLVALNPLLAKLVLGLQGLQPFSPLAPPPAALPGYLPGVPGYGGLGGLLGGLGGLGALGLGGGGYGGLGGFGGLGGLGGLYPLQPVSGGGVIVATNPNGTVTTYQLTLTPINTTTLGGAVTASSTSTPAGTTTTTSTTTTTAAASAPEAGDPRIGQGTDIATDDVQQFPASIDENPEEITRA